MDALLYGGAGRNAEPRGAGRLGQRIAALYRCWSGRAPVDLVALTTCLLGRLGGQELPLGVASLKVAAAVAMWGGHPYHSAGHHAEVVTNVAVLLELSSVLGSRWSRQHMLLLLAAASAHDYGYLPGRASQDRFAAERFSAEAMDGVARRCGVSERDRQDIGLLILATEPGSRRLLASGSDADVPKPLEPLVRRPDLVALASVLSDADLLSSAGLSLQWHQMQRARLERELGRRIKPADDIAFFDGVVGDGFLSVGGQYFAPNLVRIRAAVGQEAARGQAGTIVEGDVH